MCLSEAPEYFFVDCPASTTGKYHSLDELGPDGTIVHTRKVVAMAVHLCTGLDCEAWRDEIVSVCIIHDLVKLGETRQFHTVKNHPDLAVKLVKKVQAATKLLTEDSFNVICNGVGYHYGPWSINPWKKPIEEYTIPELCVYVADYIASRRDVDIEYKKE